MMSQTKSKRIAAVRRLAYADVAFRHAHDLCAHVENLDPHNIVNLWAPLLSGIIVTYMKPFGRCDGLGPLPSSFSNFPAGSPHKQTHDYIAGLRNWTCAHRDLIKSPKLLSTIEEQQAISEITLQFANGGLTIHTSEPTWDPETLPSILALCDFQISRIAAELKPLLKTLAGTKIFKDGNYILGRDFP